MVTVLDKQALRYSQALDASFPFFFSEIIRHKYGFKAARTQIEIADWMANGPNDRGVLAYREAAKTWLLVAYILWRGRRDPKRIKAKLVSETEGHSIKSLVLGKEWIYTLPFLAHLKPRSGRDTRHRNNISDMDFGPCSPVPAPSIHAIGITGQVTGGRSNLLGLDDIETPNNTLTVHQRETLVQRYEELEFLSRHGEVIVVGTYHHEDSLYLKMAEQGYTFRAWPCRYPSLDPHADDAREKVLFLAPQVAQRLDDGDATPGTPLDPDINSDESITRQELKVGRSTALRQLMLVPGAADITKYPLRQRDLIVFDAGETLAPATLVWGKQTSRGPTNVEGIPVVGFAGDALYRPVMVGETWLPYRGVYAFIDPAGSGADALVVAPCPQLHGNLYLPDLLSITGDDKVCPANLARIAEFLRDHRVTHVWIEKNFGGEFMLPLLQPVLRQHFYAPTKEKASGAPTHDAYPDGWSCTLDLVHNSVQKEVRIIETLEPVLNAHRLVVSEKVAAHTTLMRQLTRITKQRNCLDHDDELDAVAGVVARWAPELNQDAQLQTKRHQDFLREQTLKEWNRYLNQEAGTPSIERTSWMHY